MNEVWNVVEPYVLAIIAAFGGGSVIAVIARFVCKKIVNHASEAYDVNKIAEKVADKLGGKTIDVDITTITEKRLSDLSKVLAKEVKAVADETNSYKRLLTLIGGAIAHLKMLSEEERKAIYGAIRELDDSYSPKEKEVVATVKLEPIETKQETVKSEYVNME